MRWWLFALLVTSTPLAAQFYFEPAKPYYLVGDFVTVSAFYPWDGPTRNPIITTSPSGAEDFFGSSDFVFLQISEAGTYSFLATYYSVSIGLYRSFTGSLTALRGEDDEDVDGLTNEQERDLGTDPLLRDTDGDGFADKAEVDAGTDPLDPLSFPNDFSPYDEITFSAGKALFEVVERNLTWPEAALEATSRKGRLAVLPAAGLYDRVVSQIRASYSEAMWLGLTDVQVEGIWRWVNNQPLSYNRWETGEPNNGNGSGEHYAHVRPSGSTKLNDLDGASLLPPAFLLEKLGSPEILEIPGQAFGTTWVVDYSTARDGVSSAKAQTTNGQSTYREYTVTGPTVVDFWWKVSSEKNFDTFSYSLNGVNQETISGEVDWTYRTLTLPAGYHTIRWTYSKDASDAVGQDAGWLDEFAVYPAEATLAVRDGANLLTGTTTVDFGAVDLQTTSPRKTLTFANEGYVPLEVVISLPEGSPFFFEEGSAYELLLGRGESIDVPIFLSTASAGTKTVQLSISAPDSVTGAPTVTLQGVLLGQKIGVAQGGNTVASGQTVAMGLAPRTLQFTISNTGNVADLQISSITTTGHFQITQQPQSAVAPQGSTTFTVLAQAVAFGNQAGGITITSNDPDTPSFTFALSSKSFAVGGGGIREDSMATSGTGGAVSWDLATTQLPSGATGQAIKTGTTPNNGGSVLEFTSATAGVVTWSWKVSAQEEFDWLLCEVDGQEVAGISTKNGAWQTQVVQVPVGANIRWVYRKDASASAGEDAGFLADVEFTPMSAGLSFADWSATHGITDPNARPPGLGVSAMFAWLGGLDPATGADADQYKPIIEGGRLKYHFPISKAANGMQQIQFSSDLASWTSRGMSQRVLSDDGHRMVIEATAPSGTKGFFRVVGGGDLVGGMALIPAGSFSMGDTFGDGGSDERPVHTVNVSAFYMDRTETTKVLWDEVANWAAANGYDINAASADGKAADHPAYNVTWYEVVKWCNARSEKEGLTPCYTVSGVVMKTGTSNPDCNFAASGYRLPTEAEWEKAARGGLSGQRFPWGNTITHGEANYNSSSSYSYDVSPTRGYHPTYATGSTPYTSPVGSFAANGYSLYDMAGNMWEWCWDWYSSSYYASSPDVDPRGPSSGSGRVVRGGSWGNVAGNTSAADRYNYGTGSHDGNLGFRCVRRASLPVPGATRKER